MGRTQRGDDFLLVLISCAKLSDNFPLALAGLLRGVICRVKLLVPFPLQGHLLLLKGVLLFEPELHPVIEFFDCFKGYWDKRRVTDAKTAIFRVNY